MSRKNTPMLWWASASFGAMRTAAANASRAASDSPRLANARPRAPCPLAESGASASDWSAASRARFGLPASWLAMARCSQAVASRGRAFTLDSNTVTAPRASPVSSSEAPSRWAISEDFALAAYARLSGATDSAARPSWRSTLPRFELASAKAGLALAARSNCSRASSSRFARSSAVPRLFSAAASLGLTASACEISLSAVARSPRCSATTPSRCVASNWPGAWASTCA